MGEFGMSCRVARSERIDELRLCKNREVSDNSIIRFEWNKGDAKVGGALVTGWFPSVGENRDEGLAAP